MQKIVCSKCAAVYSYSHNDRYVCPSCGRSAPVTVDEVLVNVVEILIKLGVGVVYTDIRYCTSHKTKITIQLSGNIPEYLFNEIPNWSLNKNSLYCSVLPDDESDESVTKSAAISSLVDFLLDKDVDAFRAILKLTGYDVDQ